MQVSNWAGLPSRVWMEQRAATLLTNVRNQAAGAIEVGQQPRHGQAGRTQWRTIVGKLTLGALLARIEWYGGEATSLLKILVDIVGIIGTIPGAEARLAAEALLDLLHQREEVGGVGLIERASALGEHDFVAIT